MPYSEKMASKSTSFVLDVTNDDPSTSHGMTNVLLRLSEYTSPISSSGEVSKILPVNGDQGLVALARSQVACRSGEDAPQRLSCLLPHIMDWHACKVNLNSILTTSQIWGYLSEKCQYVSKTGEPWALSANI